MLAQGARARPGRERFAAVRTDAARVKEAGMSAISSSAGSSQLLYLQQLQKAQGGTQEPPDFQAEFKSRVEDAAKAVGVDPAKIPDLVKQIQDAVEQARSSVGSSGDPRSAIRDAVDGVLKQNGIDPAKFRSALEKSGRAHGHHHRHARAGQAGSAGALPDGDETGPTINSDGSVTGTRINVAA